MPQQKTLIHYAAMHCLCGSSDKLYTLMIYRLEQDASARHDNISFEAWAHWGARGAQQKATYKCQGNRSAIAEYVDRKVDEQERKDYVIVAGGKVGQNYDYWYTAPLIPYPVTIEGKLPENDGLGSPQPAYGAGYGNTGSGAAPSQRERSQRRPSAAPQYYPDDQRHRRKDFAPLDAAAEVERLRRRLAELETAATEPSKPRVTRKITLEE